MKSLFKLLNIYGLFSIIRLKKIVFFYFLFFVFQIQAQVIDSTEASVLDLTQADISRTSPITLPDRPDPDYREITPLSQKSLLYTLSSSILGNIDDVRFSNAVVKVAYPLQAIYNPISGYNISYKLNNSVQNNNRIVFIIPGFGGQSDSGTAIYFLELLYRQGFTVVSLDSPPSERSIKTASRFGVPGLQVNDAVDLYNQIKETLKWFKATKNKSFNDVSVVGTSLGGLNVSILIQIAKSRPEDIQFRQAISINPPISNVYGLNLLDQLVLYYHKREPVVFSFHYLKQRFSYFFDAIKRLVIHNISYADYPNEVEKFINRSDLTKEECEFLIGYSFSDVIDHIKSGYWKRQVYDEYLAKPKEIKNLVTFYDLFNQVSLGGWNNSKNYRKSITAEPNMIIYDDLDSTNKIIPNYHADFLEKIRGVSQGDLLTRRDDILLETSSIRFRSEMLSSYPEFTLITWKDDILLAPGEDQWIQSTFTGNLSGERASSMIFQEGSHLGGYYQKEFIEYLFKVLNTKN